MRVDQLREMSVEELQQKLHETEEELFNLRFRKGMQQQLPNPLRIRVSRREIARIKTILREHDLGIRRVAHASPMEPAGREPESSK